MPINYVLQENYLTPDPDDFRAMVQPIGTADAETVIQRMIEQGSTVTRPDILASLEDYYSAVESLVLEGYNVNTPMANFRSSVKGVFDSQADNFDPGRHQLRPSASPGLRLRTPVQARGVALKQESFKPKPHPQEFTDVNSAERDSVLTPGGMARLIGHRLKYDPAQAEQGIFFIAADAAETRVTVIGSLKPGELMFLVPDTLAAGDYTLEVRTVFKDGSQLRSGRLEAVLTAA